MSTTVLKIKNMVCPRCVTAVERLLAACGLTVVEVRLGEARVAEAVAGAEREKLRQQLEELGFALLDDAREVMVEEVRRCVLEWVRIDGVRPRLSVYVGQRVPRDYGLVSRLFSELRGQTIERMALLLRIERAKELLCVGELDVGEIAYRLGFSSLQHLSGQFKGVTGLSPRAYRERYGAGGTADRLPLDGI